MKTLYLSKAAPLALFLVMPSLSAQSVVLIDDMSGSFYASSNFNGADSGSNPDDTSFAFGNIEISGGNPGSFLEVFHEHDVDRDEFGDPINSDGFTDIQSFFNNSALSYNPSIQGNIESITFSLDVRTFEPIDTLFFTINDSSGGSVAFGEAGIGFPFFTPNGEWQTVTVPGVTQAGASSRDFTGSDPLNFGFGFLSTADTFFGAETYSLQADNFRIEITPIPEPSVSILIAFGLVGLSRRRR